MAVGSQPPLCPNGTRMFTSLHPIGRLFVNRRHIAQSNQLTSAATTTAAAAAAVSATSASAVSTASSSHHAGEEYSRHLQLHLQFWQHLCHQRRGQPLSRQARHLQLNTSAILQ